MAREQELVQDHNWQAVGETRILTVGTGESHTKGVAFELSRKRWMQRIDTKSFHQQRSEQTHLPLAKMHGLRGLMAGGAGEWKVCVGESTRGSAQQRGRSWSPSHHLGVG